MRVLYEKAVSQDGRAIQLTWRWPWWVRSGVRAETAAADGTGQVLPRSREFGGVLCASVAPVLVRPQASARSKGAQVEILFGTHSGACGMLPPQL